MIQIQNIEEEIYSHCQNLLAKLRKIETKEGLLDSEKTIGDLLEKIHHLSFLEKNCDQFIFKPESEIINEPDFLEEELEPREEITPIEEEKSNEVEIIEQELTTVEKENEEDENENFDIEEVEEEESEPKKESESKKIKLSQIKSLITQSLFDDEELQEMEEKPNEVEEKVAEIKSSKRDFKLDFNDKLAFTKLLFDGSQLELNKVIKKLNTFDKIDDAKEYLSDLYYEKHWEKVDEYAQRLWFLVESKFL